MQHHPRKRFGQHFLCDQAVISRIIAALAPRPEEHLIEIGPGQGALTIPLLARLPHLEVVELDRDLIPELERRCRHPGQLTIYATDVLMFDFASVRKDDRLLRVFGNLPYNISTPLIFHLLSYASIIQDMLFMLQKEVAERLAAPPASAHYGRLSVMVQYHCQTNMLFDVPPNAFFPPPQVQSSIIQLIPYQTLPFHALDEALFADLVKQAFGQRRKTLHNSLRDKVSREAWARAQIDSSLRPENLSVKEFVALANAVYEVSR